MQHLVFAWGFSFKAGIKAASKWPQRRRKTSKHDNKMCISLADSHPKATSRRRQNGLKGAARSQSTTANTGSRFLFSSPALLFVITSKDKIKHTHTGNVQQDTYLEATPPHSIGDMSLDNVASPLAYGHPVQCYFLPRPAPSCAANKMLIA